MLFTFADLLQTFWNLFHQMAGFTHGSSRIARIAATRPLGQRGLMYLNPLLTLPGYASLRQRDEGDTVDRLVLLDRFLDLSPLSVFEYFIRFIHSL